MVKLNILYILPFYLYLFTYFERSFHCLALTILGIYLCGDQIGLYLTEIHLAMLELKVCTTKPNQYFHI